MKRALQRFWPLIIGLSLPLLLIAFVFLIQMSARWSAPTIRTPVLYWPDSDYWLRPQVSWKVDGGELQLTYTENKLARTYQPGQTMSLWLYRPLSGESTRFEIELPDRMADGKSVALPIPEALQSLTLDDRLVSPEGYRFEVASHDSRGVFVELFGGYRSGMEYQLVGHGIRHSLPEQGRYQATGAFVAWVLTDEKIENEQ